MKKAWTIVETDLGMLRHMIIYVVGLLTIISASIYGIYKGIQTIL